MRETAPAWDAALRGGTESVVCDLKTGSVARASTRSSCRRPAGELPARGGRAPRRRPRRRPGVDRVLLDHRLRGGGSARCARRARPELPRLGRCARGHRAGVASGAGRGPGLRSTRRGRSDPRGVARASPNRNRCTLHRVHDAWLARPRRTPPRRGAGPADAHRRARLLPHVRDAGRTPPHGRGARAEVLRRASASSSAAQSSSNGSTGKSRMRSRTSSRRSSRRDRSPTGSPTSATRTSAWGPSGHARKPPQPSDPSPQDLRLPWASTRNRGAACSACRGELASPSRGRATQASPLRNREAERRG